MASNDEEAARRFAAMQQEADRRAREDYRRRMEQMDTPEYWREVAQRVPENPYVPRGRAVPSREEILANENNELKRRLTHALERLRNAESQATDLRSQIRDRENRIAVLRGATKNAKKLGALLSSVVASINKDMVYLRETCLEPKEDCPTASPCVDCPVNNLRSTMSALAAVALQSIGEDT